MSMNRLQQLNLSFRIGTPFATQFKSHPPLLLVFSAVSDNYGLVSEFAQYF